jgi:hypothetical protein
MEDTWTRRLVCGLLVLLFALAAPAAAQTRMGLVKQLEGSMLIKGRIDVAADGTVSGFSIKDQDKVDPPALAHVMRHVPHWTVHPATVDGVPVASSTPFSVRLVARRIDDDQYGISITGVSIEDDLPEEARPRKDSMEPPRYPADMLRIGASGIVYLVVRVDASGRVVDSHVEQVNLTALARPKEANLIRTRFAATAVSAARDWTFHSPATGPYAGEPHYSLRVPVEFFIDARGAAMAYGQWSVHLPGKWTKTPWTRDDDDNARTAAVPGQPKLAGTGLRLRSELEPGG